MGHFLRSVNPEAAAAYDAPVDTTLPVVGDTVRFHARPGEGRAGVLECAMIVQKVRQDGLLDGLVLYDAQDARDVSGINRKSHSVPYPSWEWLPNPRLERALERVAGLMDRVAVLEHENATAHQRFETLDRRYSQVGEVIEGLTARIARHEVALAAAGPTAPRTTAADSLPAKKR